MQNLAPLTLLMEPAHDDTTSNTSDAGKKTQNLARLALLMEQPNERQNAEPRTADIANGTSK